MNVLRFQYGGKRGYLRPMIIEALQEKPRKACELIKELEKSTLGLWKPSPGSLYPALSSMEREGIIIRRIDGKFEVSEDYLESRVNHGEGTQDLSTKGIAGLLDDVFDNLLSLKKSIETEESIDGKALSKMKSLALAIDEIIREGNERIKHQ
ncbi:MAG: helix-turn-helix transcriptional regulator [Thermoplasmatales archaeon]|nr:helix-turn-helix transcriptional regulator [Thermoplasmatales archaeon]